MRLKNPSTEEILGQATLMNWGTVYDVGDSRHQVKGCEVEIQRLKGCPVGGRSSSRCFAYSKENRFIIRRVTVGSGKNMNALALQ